MITKKFRYWFCLTYGRLKLSMRICLISLKPWCYVTVQVEFAQFQICLCLFLQLPKRKDPTVRLVRRLKSHGSTNHFAVIIGSVCHGENKNKIITVNNVP